MEIERKFLVKNDSWRNSVTKTEEIIQFYLTDLIQSPTIRLRIKGDKGYLTLKYPSQSDQALVREEYEYEIPIADVQAQMTNAKSNIIRKMRHEVAGPDNKIWEIDVFSEPRSDLILAEIELISEQDNFSMPQWSGQEVTQDNRYSNLRLSFADE